MDEVVREHPARQKRIQVPGPSELACSSIVLIGQETNAAGHWSSYSPKNHL